MDYWYELWDSTGSSLVGEYATQEEALRVVRYSLAAFGVDAVLTLTLIRETNENECESPEVIASGNDLVALAQVGIVSSFGWGIPVKGPAVSFSENVMTAKESNSVRHTHLEGSGLIPDRGLVTR